MGALYGIEGKLLEERVNAALTLVGLVDRARDKPSKFSGGMKRRLNIACALVHDPDVLLLDEPTVGVDPQSRNAIFANLESLRDRGKALVYTTHYMEEAERLCDHIVIVDHGKVVASDTRENLLKLGTAPRRAERPVARIGVPAIDRQRTEGRRMNALLALVRADLAIYLSNRRALLISFVAPILIAGFFGATLGGTPGKRPARIPIAVVDLDQSVVTKRIVEAMKKDENFDLRDFELAPAIEQVRAGKIRAAVVLPKGFGEAAPRALFRPNLPRPEIEIHVDPSQNVTMALVNGLLAQHVMEQVTRVAFGGGDGAMKVDRRRARRHREVHGALVRDETRPRRAPR